MQAEGLQAGDKGHSGMGTPELEGQLVRCTQACCTRAAERQRPWKLWPHSHLSTAEGDSPWGSACAAVGMAAALLAAALVGVMWAILLLASVLDNRPSGIGVACGLAPAAAVVVAASQG